MWVLWYNSNIEEVCVMLKVWVNYPEDEEALVDDVGDIFDEYIDYSVIVSDLGQRIVKETSAIVEVVSPENLKTKWNTHIPPEKLSDGAKTLILMLCEEARNELIFNYAFCGGNCDKFLEEIVKVYDINLFLGRFYIPFKSVYPAEGVEFMESGLVVHDVDSFIDEFYRLDDRKDIVVEDKGRGDFFDVDKFMKDLYKDN